MTIRCSLEGKHVVVRSQLLRESIGGCKRIVRNVQDLERLSDAVLAPGRRTHQSLRRRLWLSGARKMELGVMAPLEGSWQPSAD